MADDRRPASASTILLLRDSADAKEIEVFMMVRHYEIDFNSGALVFPGGSVDKGDKEIIATPALYSGGEGLDEATLSFRIAAIRETFEESGILLARPNGIEGAGRCQARQRDRGGASRRPLRRQDQLPQGADRQRHGAGARRARALCALDHAGGHAEAVRHLVLPRRRAAGTGRRP